MVRETGFPAILRPSFTLGGAGTTNLPDVPKGVTLTGTGTVTAAGIPAIVVTCI